MKHKDLLIGAGVLIFAIIVVFLLKAHILTSPFKMPSLKLKSEGEVVLLNEISKSGIKGSAKISEEDKKAKVVINLVGVKSEDDIYMHIHKGRCPNVSEIIYDLNSLINGSSESKLEVSVKELIKRSPLAINIHKNEGKKEVVVSCGNL